MSWGLTLVCSAGAACVILAARIADPLSGARWDWQVDIVANLAAQWLVVGLAGVVAAAVLRRWVSGVVCLVGVLVLSVVLLGTPRATIDAHAPGPRLRVLVFNALSQSDRGADQLELILGSGADLVALVEPSQALIDAIRDDPRAAEAYPHFRLPARAGPGFRFTLSRYPLLRGEEGFGFAWPEVREAFGYHGTRVARVETPAGPFVFVVVQMRSPRTPPRWSAGNAQVLDTVRGARALRGLVDLPVIIAGDFNGSPTGLRGRLLTTDTGLSHAKPVLRAAGSFPSFLPWPLQTVIDGALVSPGVRVVSWSVLGSAGSDHEALLIELALPGRGAD
ncbi:MAG: endonuclease/exonuclease/phosphatase family protein [Phycisphaerales bacterium]